jgi:O-antigen/teichoic acid export membrane protein
VVNVKIGGLARNSAFNFAAQAATALAAFVSIPIAFREFGAERFGLLSLMWSALAASIVLDLGTGPAVARASAASLVRNDGARLRAILRAGILLQVCLGITAALLLILIAPWLVRVLRIPDGLRPDALASIYPLALTLPIVLIAQSYQGVLEGLERFDILAYVRTPVLIATYAIPAVGALAGWSLSLTFTVLLASRALALAVLHVSTLGRLPRNQTGRARAELPGLFTYGRWLALSGIAGQVLVYLDRFIISALHGPAAVAQYAAPYDAAGKLLVIPGSFGVAMFPGLAKDSARENVPLAIARSRKVGKATLAMMIPICLMLAAFAGPLLRWWLGPEIREEGIVAFQILVFAVLLHGAAYPPLILIEALGRSAVVARYYTIELLVYTPVAALLIWKSGVVGAAAVWLVRNLVCVIWAQYYVRTYLPPTPAARAGEYAHAK